MPDLIRHALDFLLGRSSAGAPFGLGREHHARQRIAPAERLRPDLVGPPGQPAHVVQAGARVEQALLPQRVHLALALQEGGELEQERLAVERLAQELPGPGP